MASPGGLWNVNAHCVAFASPGAGPAVYVHHCVSGQFGVPSGPLRHRGLQPRPRTAVVHGGDCTIHTEPLVAVDAFTGGSVYTNVHACAPYKKSSANATPAIHFMVCLCERRARGRFGIYPADGMVDGARGERPHASVTVRACVLYLALAVLIVAYWGVIVWVSNEVRVLGPRMYRAGKAAAPLLEFFIYEGGDMYTEFVTRLLGPWAGCSGTYAECARAALGV